MYLIIVRLSWGGILCVQNERRKYRDRKEETFVLLKNSGQLEKFKDEGGFVYQNSSREGEAIKVRFQKGQVDVLPGSGRREPEKG